MIYAGNGFGPGSMGSALIVGVSDLGLILVFYVLLIGGSELILS